jgi:hypothetical protein
VLFHGGFGSPRIGSALRASVGRQCLRSGAADTSDGAWEERLGVCITVIERFPTQERQMATAIGNRPWHASYWKKAKHGRAWDRAKEALKRDWSPIKADFHANSGKELRQGADDTMKQAAGREPIPPQKQANPPDFDKVEPAIAYGFGAHEEYGQKYPTWDERLEANLSDEWDFAETGMTFDDVKHYVRHGWDYRK